MSPGIFLAFRRVPTEESLSPDAEPSICSTVLIFYTGHAYLTRFKVTSILRNIFMYAVLLCTVKVVQPLDASSKRGKVEKRGKHAK